MTPLILLGWIAACLGMASALPQIVRLARARTSAGLSLPMWQMTLGIAVSWAYRGFEVGQAQMIVANCFLVLSTSVVLTLICRDRNVNLVRALGLPLVLAAALIAIDVLAGGVAYGFVVALPSMWGQWLQLRFMRRTRDLSGVSGAYLVVAFLVQALWFVWAGLVPEWSIFVCSALMGSLCLLNVAYFYRRVARGTATAPVTPPGSQLVGV